MFQSARPRSSDGARFVGEDFFLYVKRKDTGASRLGLSVSKKVAKKACLRNRLKRCAREAFRNELQNSTADYILRFFKQPERASTEVLGQQLRLIKKMNKFNYLAGFKEGSHGF